MMEASLLDVLTWREWIQLAGLTIVFVASIYVVTEFISIVRRD